MRVELLDEPELDFGAGRHVDIRFGLMRYGPLDQYESGSPKAIKAGVVGTGQTVHALSEWLAGCADGVQARTSNQPNLFPRFPGFGDSRPLPATVESSPRLQRAITSADMAQIGTAGDRNACVAAAVELFVREMQHLVQSANPDVLICALPWELLNITDTEAITQDHLSQEDEDDEGTQSTTLNLHHMLKAAAMRLNRPVQIVRPSTYGLVCPRHLDSVRQRKSLQDDATRAWNLYIALYYKAGGRPWRLVRQSSEWSTCYIGISFYRSLDEATLQTSVAHVFNERGEGLVVRGGPAQITREDRQPHLTADDAHALMESALLSYHNEHRNMPARVVVHKTSLYTEGEVEGLGNALEARSVEITDLLSPRLSSFRLLRLGAYPPIRGTVVYLDGETCALYTRGSVSFFRTYPGMYLPRSLELRLRQPSHTSLKALAEETLALTKMNWNNTQFDGAEPITLEAARRVGAILKYTGPDGYIVPRYSYFM